MGPWSHGAPWSGKGGGGGKGERAEGAGRAERAGMRWDPLKPLGRAEAAEKADEKVQT